MSSETVHTDPECQSNKLNQAKCGSKTTSQFTYVLQLVHSHTLNWYLCILYADAQVIGTSTTQVFIYTFCSRSPHGFHKHSTIPMLGMVQLSTKTSTICSHFAYISVRLLSFCLGFILPTCLILSTNVYHFAYIWV